MTGCALGFVAERGDNLRILTSVCSQDDLVFYGILISFFCGFVVPFKGAQERYAGFLSQKSTQPSIFFCELMKAIATVSSLNKPERSESLKAVDNNRQLEYLNAVKA